MPKKKRMPLAESRFGGRATAGGVNYEVRVAAWIAVKMLAGDRCVAWEGINGADISAIMTQAPEPVDDVVVSLREGQDACVYISAKERAGAIPLTPKSPAFGDTVGAFVRQFLKLPKAARSKSRFVWAVPSSAGRAATQDLTIALDNHREDAGGQTLSEFLRSRGINQRKAVKALLGIVGREWRKETGSTPTDNQRRSLLQCIYVWVFEFEWGRRQEHEAESDIRTHLVEDPKQANRAWRILEHLFARADHHGIRVTASSLRRALTADGVVLKSVPEYAPDIARLVDFTTRNLANLREHTTLRFGRMPSDAVHLHRGAELSALLLAVKSGHCLITGEPGCGKSGLIYSLVEALQKESVPVVLLLAEEICHRDWKGSANLPGLAHALDIVLANWPAGHSGLLVTDALDAVRDVAAQRMLRRLLCDVKDGQSTQVEG